MELDKKKELMRELAQKGYTAQEIARELDKLNSAWQELNREKQKMRESELRAQQERRAKLIKMGEVVEKHFGLVSPDYLDWLLNQK